MTTVPHRSSLVRCIGLMAATVMLAAAPRADAMSLAGGRAAMTPDVPIHKVQFHGHRGGGRGGFHGGGFHAAPRAFHGGNFHAARPAFAGGFRHGPVFRHGGFHHEPIFAGRRHYAPVRFHRHFRSGFYGYASPYYYGYAPGYYYGPRRFCRVIWTHYGPRRVCHYRSWHHHWRHHYWRHHHWHSHRWHHHRWHHRRLRHWML